MAELTEADILRAFATDQSTATSELTRVLNEIAFGNVLVNVTLPGTDDPFDIAELEQAISAYHAIRRMVTNAGVSGSTLRTGMLAQFDANPNDPTIPPATPTVNDMETWMLATLNGGSTLLNAGDIVGAFSGVPSLTIHGSGNPPATGDEFTVVSGNVIEPTTDIPGMCGLTTYNRVEGHFFLKQLPQPKLETVSRSVQGIADRFESQYEDPSMGNVVSQNEKVMLSEQVFLGEALNVITSSRVATYTTVSTSIEKHAIVAQGGDSFIDATYGNVVSSSQDTMVAIAVEDIRPFSLKGFDTDEDALFDLVEPTKPTNENYVRHLTPEKESRVAVLETPQALQDAGGPPHILIYYNAIDPTGETVAAWKGDTSWLTVADHAQTYRNDIDAINGMEKKGWLIVEKTVPDTNTVFVDMSHGYPVYRSVLEWLRRPYDADEFSSPPTWTPLTIHAPGGIISVPSKDFQSGITNHSLRANPTGDLVVSPFINTENCAHTVIQETIAGKRIRKDAYGPPIAVPNTRTMSDKNDSIYHTLTIASSTKNKDRMESDNEPSLQPVNYEQFDIIDNQVQADRHLLLIHPSHRERSNTLSTIFTQQNGANAYHNCTIEMTLMRGRVEEIAPTSGDASAGGVALRGRSQLVDITDRVAERDFELNEGFALKEIGDLGSPAVSITLGGLGQGGIDVAATRTQHSKLPVWKDKVIGTNNPSVRNDRQTSTYYASTRALVELPLFPSMFYDVAQVFPSSTNKRSALPTDKAMEVVVDCTMSAVNRPQMQGYENRWAIDWGLRGEVSSLKIHDYKPVVSRTIIRFMRDSVSTYLNLLDYSSGETTTASGTTKTTTYIEVDSIHPFIEESGIDVPNYGNFDSGVRVQKSFGSYAIGTVTFNVDTVDANTKYKKGDIILNSVGALVGTIESINSAGTQITLTSGSEVALANNAELHLPRWTFTNNFAVTVGEGIICDGGIRLNIYKIEPHRLYFNAFHRWDDVDATLSEIKDEMIVGLPVVMGCWISDNDTTHNGSVWALTDLNADVGTSNATMAQNFITPMEKALCLRESTSDNRTALCIDPNDDSRILINRGPTMEGFSFDPGNYLYGDDDFPLRPPVECRTGHLALKGKRNDDSLDFVRPLHINLGSVASSKNVNDFNTAVAEVVRRINQAGHPDAKNENGGSAFNPPQLFTEAVDTHTVSSTDTGSHMGYVRAFMGQSVESRDGESGFSIVIHSTIPGATGRNFAVWLNNNSPYPYRPTQAVGHGGLLATNSRSYQASSFPAPLPLGMDGETHIPITTFQGGVHGRVEDTGGNLRTYNGVGSEFVFNVVTNGKRDNGDLWPAYDLDSFPHISVERKALDLIGRISSTTSAETPGYIEVNGEVIGTFENIAANIGASDCLSEGVGACCFLLNAKPTDIGLRKKWTALFVDRQGKTKDAQIKMLYPLPDAHGILFFGGGHTGTVFDISDGTDNDYSDFYTHHYSKGSTGYSGFQNLHEVQTSAAVLDFTNVKNADSVKDNTYRGLHTKFTVKNSGESVADAHYVENDCMFYCRLNEDELFSTDHGTAGKEIVAETMFGRKLFAYGNFSASALSGPVTDPESKGLDFATSNNAALALHKIVSEGEKKSQFRVGVPESFGTSGSSLADYSISFFFSAKPNTGSWSSEGYGNGPVIHGIDDDGFGMGVSIETKENTDSTKMDVNFIARVSTGSAEYDYVSPTKVLTKDAWHHVVFVHDAGDDDGTFYINGVALGAGTSTAAANTDNVDEGSYNAGTIADTPHLPIGIGVPTLETTGVLINNSSNYSAGETKTLTVDGVDADDEFSVGDEVLTNGGDLLGIVHSVSANKITLTTKNIVAVNDNDNLKQVKKLTSNFYGRSTNMMTIGTALHTYEATSTSTTTYTATGVLINQPGSTPPPPAPPVPPGYQPGDTTLDVTGVSPSTKFNVGDTIYNASGNALGTIASMTSNQIVLNAPGLLLPLADQEELYEQTVTVTAYYYGRHHGGNSNEYDPIYFKGALSDIAMWNKQLSQADVTELYSARTVWD